MYVYIYMCESHMYVEIERGRWSSGKNDHQTSKAIIYIYTIYAYMFINYRNTNKDITSYKIYHI